MLRNSVLEGFSDSRLAVIQSETAVKVDLSEATASLDRLGLKEIKGTSTSGFPSAMLISGRMSERTLSPFATVSRASSKT